jgi:nucleoside-diphosphate-sugar epimerase
MKVAVTGGAGFIGQAVVTALKAAGHDPVSFDRRHGNDILGDLSALDGCDAVIHLAGVLGTHELFETIQLAIDVNVSGSARIMQWCVEHDAQYVGILMPDVFPSVYTATKVATQRLASALRHSRGLRVSHVRAYNAFGPGQAYGPGHPQKIVPTFAMAGWRGQSMPIWGTGRQTVDLIYVDDLARLLVDAMAFDGGQVFDGGTRTRYSVGDVAHLIQTITGSNADPEYFAMRDGEIESNICAWGESWDLLSWKPALRIADLRKTVEWYKELA